MPYFCYYHRHLLICVEIALNYAEEVLLGGKERLDRELYGKFSGLFDAVFERYGEIVKGYRKEKDISGDLPELAMHYWDPSDYTHTMDLPDELKEHKPTEID